MLHRKIVSRTQMQNSRQIIAISICYSIVYEILFKISFLAHPLASAAGPLWGIILLPPLVNRWRLASMVTATPDWCAGSVDSAPIYCIPACMVVCIIQCGLKTVSPVNLHLESLSRICIVHLHAQCKKKRRTMQNCYQEYRRSNYNERTRISAIQTTSLWSQIIKLQQVLVKSHAKCKLSIA